MSEASPYAFGTPTWMELSTPDPEASKAFYCGLLGWESYTYIVDPLGDYTHFTLPEQGAEMAGLLTLADDAERSAWSVYFTVADVEASGAATRAADGQVHTDAIDIAHLGCTVYCSDTQGVDFAFWKPYTFFGNLWRIGGPGTLRWIDLHCQDPGAARRFYGAVLGWEYEEMISVTGPYTECQVAGAPFIGITPAGQRLPADHPPCWLPHFAVTDCTATVATAKDLGGALLTPPTEGPEGMYTIVSDPAGAPVLFVQPAD